MACLPFFSHVYAEERVLELSETRAVLAGLKAANVVPVRHYKDVFNRVRQDWTAQRQSRKLILALREKDFLYPGAEVCDPCGGKNFYYTSLLMNCVYDCDYCYLQGLYPSANLVLFVNNGAFMEEACRKLQSYGSIYLSLSYDTDLLALEKLTGFCRDWIELAGKEPSLLLEIRTKSANAAPLKELKARANVILAFTLSPAALAGRHEKHCPPTEKRLSAARELCLAGWPVRIVFDPVLLVPDWKKLYGELIEQVFGAIPGSSLRDVSVGPFRMNAAFLKKIKRARREPAFLYRDYELNAGVASYRAAEIAELQHFFTERLNKHLPMEKLFFGGRNLP